MWINAGAPGHHFLWFMTFLLPGLHNLNILTALGLDAWGSFPVSSDALHPCRNGLRGRQPPLVVCVCCQPTWLLLDPLVSSVNAFQLPSWRLVNLETTLCHYDVYLFCGPSGFCNLTLRCWFYVLGAYTDCFEYLLCQRWRRWTKNRASTRRCSHSTLTRRV